MIRLGNRQRRRRQLSARWARLLPWLGFRRDSERSTFQRTAYILRGVGNRLGPVLMVDRAQAQPPPAQRDAENVAQPDDP